MSGYDLKRQAVQAAWLDLRGVQEVAERDPRIANLIDIDSIEQTMRELELAFIDELDGIAGKF